MPRTDARKGRSNKARAARTRIAVQPGVLADLDTQLMLRVRAGSPDAANALVRRNFKRVWRYIARILRGTGPVEDLVQDVFVRVLNSSKRYEPTAKFSTWLYRIATNTALNYLNAAHRRDRQEPDPEAGGLEVPTRPDAAPERELSLDELRDRVSLAIGSLPVNQRIALTLFEYEELSYGQIAKVLDTSVDAVRSLLKRARESLRGKLGGLV